MMNPNHAEHGSTSIPVYPRTARASNESTSTATLVSTNADAANERNAARAGRRNTTVPNYQAYENDHPATSRNTSIGIPAYENDHHDDGSYSDDSAVQQARQHMEEIRSLHPVQLPKPEEMAPPLPSAARVLAEPSIPVPRSSRRVSQSVRRPPDLVRGKVYRFDNNDDDMNNDQPAIQKLQSDEMLVRCESCQRYLQVCKSAIVVQCPACRAISPAKSTN
jgi:hypothetical protein